MGRSIEEIRADGTILWLHADQAGSIRVVTDQDGTVVGTADWDAYGALVERTGADVSRLGFQGNYTDPEPASSTCWRAPTIRRPPAS